MYYLENCDKALTKAILEYMPSLKEQPPQYINDIINDIYISVDKYKFSRYDEYFKYDFFNLSDEKRKTFMGGKEYFALVKESFIGDYDKCLIFKNKYETYKILKKYYNRKVIYIKNFDNYNDFCEFVQCHKTFIVKKESGSLGINIKKFSIHSNDEIKPIFFKLLQYDGCVCEEWIEQCQEFAKFCDSCVNTVRLISLFDERGLIKVYAMFRTGRNDSIVDNASMGGIAAAVDTENGIIISDGYTKLSLEHFEYHPESKKKYKGFQIPKWKELLVLVEKLHREYKNSRYVGWDFTLTDNGWVLIEGNSKPNIDTIQIINYRTFGCGIRDSIINALGKYAD